MHYLKQSTITTIQLGPFLDETDGKTAEEGLTIEDTDVYLSKAGAAFAVPNDTNNATHDRAGWYRKQLNATDTATVGRLIVSVHESGALPVWREFIVLTSKVYESLIDGTDYLEVDIEAVSGDEGAADNLELDYDGTGYAKTNSTMGTVTTNTDLVSAVAVRTEMDSNSTKLADIVADTNELQADDTPAAIAALPTAAENRTEMDDNSTKLADIVADTNELQVDDVPGLIGALNDVSTAEVNAQVDTALSDIHLDHLLAVEYDPASQPGVATALLNELIEDDGGVSRYTANALEEAPTGGSAPTVGEIADAVWDELVTGHDGAGKAGQQLWTDVDAILADTSELQADDTPAAIAALPTAAENRAEMDSNSTKLADIVADTNELQADDTPAAIAALPTAVENRTEMDSNSTKLSDIVADTSELQVDDVPGLIGALNDVSTAEVNAQVDTALSDIHLDHLLAVEYDPASQPGVATALLNELIEDDGGVSRYTANALEEAPGGSSLSDILNVVPLIPNSIDFSFGSPSWRIGLMLVNSVDDLPSTAEITPGTINIAYKDMQDSSWTVLVNDQACSEDAGLIYYDEEFDDGLGYGEGQSIRIIFKNQKITVDSNDYEITGSTGRIFYTYIRQTSTGSSAATIADAVWEELIADHSGTSGSTAEALDAAGGGSTPAAIADAVWNELSTGHTDAGKAGQQLWTDVDAILADTNELQADNTPAAIAALPTAAENRAEMDSNSTKLADIVADTNELQADDTPAAIAALPTAAENRTEMDDNSTKLADIVADTNELQVDDVPGLIAALNDPSLAAIADQVWEELIADHSGTAGSTAEALNAAGGGSTPAAIADAVWNENSSGHTSFGNAGYQLWTVLNLIDSTVGGLPTATENRDAMDQTSVKLIAIAADTDELQTDDVPGLIAALNDPTAAAVADQVWEEAIADHSGTSGSTAEALNNIPGAVRGAVEYTYTIDDGSNPIDGAEVWITTDSGGNNVIWSGTSDALGVARASDDEKPWLDAGTYYGWAQKAGYSFSNPDTLAVS